MQVGSSRLTCTCLQNNPLYLEAFYVENQEEALKFHYIVHCALDAVEEKGALDPAPGQRLTRTAKRWQT